MTAEDPYNLQRFVTAQQGDYAQACAELRAGRKQSHWIWFIFPQMRGLGSSQMADYYGIASRQEAEAYLAHPLLGARLRECTRLVLDVEGRSIDEILGYPDNLKFRSSMTLFDAVASVNAAPKAAEAEDRIFHAALRKYFAGKPDPLTLGLL
jgi:uncharacterized protein (DUF1810 family)